MSIPSRLFVLSVLLLTTPLASAQPVADAKGGNAWIAFVVAIFLAVLVLGGAFMSSRRGHQD
ncbi:MAG: hypothetical protein AAF333_10475 [Planctomycetota bacterium]